MYTCHVLPYESKCVVDKILHQCVCPIVVVEFQVSQI